MRLVEKHLIKAGHPYFKEIDQLCFLSKNLYNVGLYEIRQHFFKTKTFLCYEALQKQLQNDKNVDYYALPTKISQQTLKTLCKNFKSFFKALQEYQINPSKFKAPPKLPKYKDKTKGRNIVQYPIDAISKPALRNGLVKLSQTSICIPTKQDKIQQARIVPLYGAYKIEVVYLVITPEEKEKEKNKKEEKEKTSEKKIERIAGVDLGLNNLAAITSNLKDFSPFLINGRPLKSINQYFNKKRAKLMSFIGNEGTSPKLEKLTFERNCKVENYLHQSSRILVDLLVEHKIQALVIGKNEDWKQEIHIGKKNNQNFVCIPHQKFIQQLTYKCQLLGIRVHLTEESYTSKCSLLDLEPLKKQDSYLGKRVKRGLFKTNKGLFLNADINAAGNIIRKVFPNAFNLNAEGIQGILVYPKRLNPLKVKVQ